MNRTDVISGIYKEKIIAIARGMEYNKIKPFAEAVMRGGIEYIEITFVQDAPETWDTTCESIRLLNTLGVTAGAGTVLTQQQLLLARDAGANYIISPNADPEIIRKTRELGLVSIPGVLTPTEIVAAYAAGADFVKLFPVNALGEDYIKAVRAPLKHIPMLAVGGVTPEKLPSYLKAGCAGAGVGGKLVKKELIDAGDFAAIEQAARAYVKAAESTL